MYNQASVKATEFISHEEILDTLREAEIRSKDKEALRIILDKARECKGISHREAATLLACDDPEITAQIFSLAKEIKERFYGNRIVMFAPLYLSNYCVNGCIYCLITQRTRLFIARN